MSQILTDEEIACYDPAIARAIESAVLAKIATTPAASPTLLEMLIVGYGRAQRDMGYADAKGDEKGLSKNAGRADQDMAQIRGMLSAFAASTTPEPSPLVAPRWMPIESAPKDGTEFLDKSAAMAASKEPQS